MATAKKLPSGSYRVQVFSHKDENGKRHYESFTAPTKREAEQRAAEYIAHKDRLSRSDLTVSEALRGYIALKEKVLSPSTIKGYFAILHNYEPINDTRISRLDNKTVQGFINNLSAASSPKYVRNIYTLFSSAVAMYSPNTRFNVTLPQKAQRITKAPSEAQIKMLYDKASGKLKKAIFLGMLGLRRGEICALLYSDIDGNLLHINKDMVKSVNGWVIKETPKTSESERIILLPDNFRDIIGNGEGRIVACCPNHLTVAFHELGLKNGVDIRFHDLRHYFVSMAHAMGIPDRFIMAMGGFKSDFVMKSVYRNTMDDLEKKYREDYAEKISGLTF